MSLLGLYHPAPSPLHRLPAGAKLAALLVAAIALFMIPSRPFLLGSLLVCALLYALARIPGRLAWAQLRPIAVIVLFVFGFQWLFLGLNSALTICIRLVVLVALAALMTLTTRTTELVTAVEWSLGPLRRLGFDPTRFGLLVALTLRSIPVLTAIANEIRSAQRARGVSWSIKGFVLPFVVRTLRHTESLGEALAARGVDD